MGPFAHLGLTAGAAVVVNSVWHYRRKPDFAGRTTAYRRPKGFWRPLGVRPLLAVLFGAVLSDLIDKPIGNLFFESYFANGRIFAHTLLFLLVIAALGLALYLIKKRTWLLWVAFGVLMHLILDEMWLVPQTLLWPLLSTEFPRYENMETIPWLLDLLRAIISDPKIIISEVVGMILGAWVALLAWRRRAY